MALRASFFSGDTWADSTEGLSSLRDQTVPTATVISSFVCTRTRVWTPHQKFCSELMSGQLRWPSFVIHDEAPLSVPLGTY